MRLKKGMTAVDMKSVIKCVATLTLAIAAMPGFSLSLKNPAMSVEQMTKESDEIVVGQVIKIEPRMIRGSFETDYKIAVQDRVKGGSPEMGQGQVFTLTLPGAVLTSPPLTQYVSGVPYLSKNEDVFLFLKNGNSAVAAKIKNSTTPQLQYSASPKIVGWNQGRFTVISNPQSGEKMVARVNLENYGLMNSDKATQEILTSIKESRIALKNTPIVRSKDAASESRDKDPLEVTAADSNKLKMDSALQQGELLNLVRQRGGIPAQDYEKFKAEVQGYANQ